MFESYTFQITVGTATFPTNSYFNIEWNIIDDVTRANPTASHFHDAVIWRCIAVLKQWFRPDLRDNHALKAVELFEHGIHIGLGMVWIHYPLFASPYMEFIHTCHHNTTLGLWLWYCSAACAWISVYPSENKAGLILGLRSDNERRCYKVTPSLIGWAQTKNQPCKG